MQRKDGSFWYWGLGAGLEDAVGLPEGRYASYLLPDKAQMNLIYLATVSGVVEDEAGNPIAGALLRAKLQPEDYGTDNSEFVVYTGTDGTYSLQLPPLKYTLSVERIGYFPGEPLPNQTFGSGEVRTFDYMLSKDPTQFPTIHLTGGFTAVIEAGAPFTDPGYTAYDEQDGDVTGDVIVTGSVNPSVPGVYVLTYSVEDSDGLTATAQRVIIVVPADSASAVREAMFFDGDLTAGQVRGTIRWSVADTVTPTSFHLLWADGNKKTLGTIGSRLWSGAASYSFTLPSGTIPPATASYLAIVAGAQGAAYVPLTDVASPEQLYSQVRSAADRNNDGFRIDAVTAFMLQYKPDVTGDGTFDRADVSLLLHAIPALGLQ